MKKLLLTLVFGILAVGVYGQTIKSLGYNTTNGQVIANTGTNVLQFTNNVSFQGGSLINGYGVFYVSATNGGLNLEEGRITDINNTDVLNWSDSVQLAIGRPLTFGTNAATTRTNLGLGWTALTNTNAANFRTAINAAPTSVFKVKASDQSITNDTNFMDVTDMVFNTEPNKRYIVQLAAVLEVPSGSPTAHSLRLVASDATVVGNWDGITADSFSTTPLTNAFSYSLVTQLTTRIPINTFMVISGTNAGSVKLQFAQATASTNFNTIKANSWLKADEVNPQ
jgi:hypothetical protein